MRAVLTLCALTLVPAAYAGNCACTTATLNMGAYDVYSAGNTDTSVNLQITCNGNAQYNIAFSTGSSNNFGTRTLVQDVNNALNYNIYTDTTRQNVWAGTNVFVNNSSGVITVNETLYLRIFPLQDVTYSGSSYQDTINVDMTPSGGGPHNTCSFTLQTTVTPVCNAPNATLAFGNYDPVSANSAAPLDQSVSPSYTCTKGVTANIGLDNGQNFSTFRRMAGPSANFLNYEIYTDSGRTLRWTNASPGWVTATSTGKDNPLTAGASPITAYGRVFAAQDVVGGAYADSVTATVNY